MEQYRGNITGHVRACACACACVCVCVCVFVYVQPGITRTDNGATIAIRPSNVSGIYFDTITQEVVRHVGMDFLLC